MLPALSTCILSPFGTASLWSGKTWRSACGSSRTTSRRISPETIPLPFRRRCQRAGCTVRRSDARITCCSLFPHARVDWDNKLPPATRVTRFERTDNRLRATTALDTTIRGRGRGRRYRARGSRDPDLAAADDVTCASTTCMRARRVLVELSRTALFAPVSGTFGITIRLIRSYFLNMDRGDIVARGNAVLGINVLRCHTVCAYMREFPTLREWFI